MNRDNERANRRYAVIRGRKARPVASARATVEVLDSIKDAIQDESESSDSSSEADDEGGDEDEARKPTDTIATESSPEQSVTLPTVTVQDAATVAAVPVVEGEEPSPAPPSSTPPLPSPAEQLEPSPSFPPSPFLTSQQPGTNLPPTPPQIDEIPGRSLFKQAFQGLSQGLFSTQFPPRRSDPEAEDPFNDPEHIFRDSSMVVRTDEPTSIIALALK
jgi:1-phosphatidylinositol-3-phosphate 5-kinase